MLGKRNPQASLFDAIGLPHRVAPDSFYGRMGQMIHKLFRDEDLQEMYCADNGRPSLPPSLLAGVLLLQFYDDVSDREAAERVVFDLRWKVALNLSLDYQGFDFSNLSNFRGRLAEYHQERYAFDKLLEHARKEGVLANMVTILTDTTNAKGAGATQDTYTLLRKGIRKLIKTMGYHLPGKRAGCSAQVESLLKTYVDQDRKAEIDWSDVPARNAQLKTLVDDSEAALELALEQMDDPEVRSLGWMISKIIADDVEETPEGGRKIRQGTAADRIISLYDTEMRHGRKSASKKFDGHKVSTTMDQASELILDIEDLAAPLGDGQDLLPAIARIEAHVDVIIERAIGDGAYGSGENRAACAERANPVDLLVPVSRPSDPEVHRSAFQVDFDAKTATCPNGQTVSGPVVTVNPEKRVSLAFTFERSVCQACPLFERCVRSKTEGRSIQTSFYESYLLEARQRQETLEFKEFYRLRPRIEGKQSELVAHGLRNTRYIGKAKRRLQRLFLATAVNLNRFGKLLETRAQQIEARLMPAKEVRISTFAV
jgi:hypothetical protein